MARQLRQNSDSSLYLAVLPLADTIFCFSIVCSVQGVEPQKLPKVDTRPHYIVRRYAEYFGALLGLNEDVHFDPVTAALARLRQEGAKSRQMGSGAFH